MIDQLKTLAVKVLGMTDDEWQSLIEKTDEGETLKPDAINTLVKKDQERMKRFKEDHKTELTAKYNDGYNESKKKERQKFEEEIKAEFGLDSKNFGVELVKEIVSLNKESKPQDIKTHPDYLKLEKSLQNDFVPKTKFDEVNTEFEHFKSRIEKERVFSQVDRDALNILDSLNPQLPQDAKKAVNLKNLFLRQIKEGYDFQPQEDGNHLILKGEKRLENENMNPIAFADFIKDKAAELFDFKVQSGKANSGVESPQGGADATFTNRSEFFQAWNSAETEEEKVKIFEKGKAAGFV